MNASEEQYKLTFDGGSRGNPGLCGIGYVIYKNDNIIYKNGAIISEYNTNNFAEYSALIAGLKKAIELNIKSLQVYGDSQLIIKQLNGVYSVKSNNIKDLFLTATLLKESFQQINFKHIYRDKNKLADALANQAMDNYKKKDL